MDFEAVQIGLAALGTAITVNNHCSIENATPDLFRELQTTIPQLRENRDVPIKKEISITREQSRGWKPEAVIVVDSENFSRVPFNREQHNDPKFGFRVLVNDERGEPIRAQAGDILTNIIGKHPWMTALATGKEMNWAAVEKLRAEKAEAKAAIADAARAEVEPTVMMPHVLADKYLGAAQSVTSGEPAADTRAARKRSWPRWRAANTKTAET